MSVNITTRKIGVTMVGTRQVRVTQTQLQQINTGQQGLPGVQGQDGADGPPGVAGPSGDGQYPVIEFAHGDAPAIVMALTGDHASEITKVTLEIEEAFDGTAPQIMLGTPGDPDLLMPASYNDPTTAATYEVAPGVELPAGQPIYLTIIPGVDSTQGSGKIVVTASPTT